MVELDSVAYSPSSSRKAGSKSPLESPLEVEAGEQALRLGRQHPASRQDRAVEGRRVVRQVADARRADLDRPGADSHRPRPSVAVAVAVLGQHAALVSGSAQELIDLHRQGPLEHATGALARQLLDGVVDDRSRRLARLRLGRRRLDGIDGVLLRLVVSRLLRSCDRG